MYRFLTHHPLHRSTNIPPPLPPQEKTKDLSDHRDDSTFSFDPETLTHAKPLDKNRKNRRIVVMRRGAGIISDRFNK